MVRAKSAAPGIQQSASSATVSASHDKAGTVGTDNGGGDEDTFESSQRAIDAAFSVISARAALNATRQRLSDELTTVQHQSMEAIRAGTAVHVGLTKSQHGGMGDEALKLADHYIAQSGSNPNDIVEDEHASAATAGSSASSPVPPVQTASASAGTTNASVASTDSTALADGEPTEQATAPEPDYSLPSPSPELAATLAAGFDPLDPFGSNVSAPQHLLLSGSVSVGSTGSDARNVERNGNTSGSSGVAMIHYNSATAVLVRSLDAFVNDWTAKERMRTEQAVQAAADGISNMARLTFSRYES